MSIPGTDELQLLHEQICQAVGDVKRIQILYALHEQPRHTRYMSNRAMFPHWRNSWRCPNRPSPGI